jgi:hypothetical protein
MIRAVGPALGAFGVTGAIADRKSNSSQQHAPGSE